MRSFLFAISFVLSFIAAGATNLELIVPAADVEAVADHTAETRTFDAPPLGHYGPPPNGCESDEKAFQISGIPGGVCAAKCTDFLPCPKDVPDGVTAQPQCALQDRSTGSKYCVLLCNPSNEEGNSLRGGNNVEDSQCGDATCQAVKGSGLGICTYPMKKN